MSARKASLSVSYPSPVTALTGKMCRMPVWRLRACRVRKGWDTRSTLVATTTAGRESSKGWYLRGGAEAG
jgi:hypothetical protein